MTKRVIMNKPCPCQNCLMLSQGCGNGLIAPLFRQSTTHGCNKSETILKIMRLGGRDQPIPVKIWILQNNPRQRLREPAFQFIAVQSRKKTLTRILLLCGPQIAKPWITQSRKTSSHVLVFDFRSLAPITLNGKDNQGK